MEEFRILKFLDIFDGMFQKFGIDYDTMRKILKVKLTLDGRRTPTTMLNSSNKKKKDGNNLIKSLGLYILLGIVFIPFIVLGESYLFQMSFVFGVIMFMMTITLVSDFSTVLLDLKDKDIILSRPINSKTLNIAKMIHITIYMFYITIAFIGPGFIAGFIKHGLLFSMIFFIEIILMDLLIIVLTALLYLLILKFFDGEKLKDIINYFQIILTITITVGYQLLGRLFSFDELLNIEFTPKPWQYILPPIWFGGPFELILNGNVSNYILMFTALAVVMPIIAIIIYTKLIPIFEYNLQKLNDTSGHSKPRNKGLNFYLAKIVCRSKEERTFFRFATNMIKKERVFKLRVYPSLGFSMIFPFIFILTAIGSEGLGWLKGSKMFLSLYFVGIMVPNIIMNLGYSGNYKGAWIYKIAPVVDLLSIIKGAVKASLVNIILPLYVLISIVSMFVFGGEVFIHLIIIFISILLYITICSKILNDTLPFSEPFETANHGSGLAMIPLMLLLGLFALAHFIAMTIPYGILIYMVVLIIINLFTWKKVFEVNKKLVNNR
ncbi:hypothetical protein K8M07_05765 [Schnuerera sp. xch1]|uniref:hypothetical protein n=1 Tax=Schnuerera sp. xch1 TaxID=2874283 RepID=UPI001CBCDD18|nr:hypothetical protein [Schnuerera sp. xch1]MBZ2174752.1 hypothetical protein [Schnuerera sp. xch1]